MGIYSNTQIQASIENGSIVCVPFNALHVKHAGLRLSLGSYYYHTEQSGPAVTHNAADSEDNERYFNGPFKALTHEQQCSLSGIRTLNGLALDHPVILLKPGERIIAHSHEFICVPVPRIARLEEVASWHQSGVTVTPNFDNLSRITRPGMTIQNTNAQTNVILPVGAPIARLVFDEVGTDDTTHTQIQQRRIATEEIDTAISMWTPGSLLARTVQTPTDLPPKVQGLRYE